MNAYLLIRYVPMHSDLDKLAVNECHVDECRPFGERSRECTVPGAIPFGQLELTLFMRSSTDHEIILKSSS